MYIESIALIPGRYRAVNRYDGTNHHDRKPVGASVHKQHVCVSAVNWIVTSRTTQESACTACPPPAPHNTHAITIIATEPNHKHSPTHAHRWHIRFERDGTRMIRTNSLREGVGIDQNRNQRPSCMSDNTFAGRVSDPGRWPIDDAQV